MPPPSWRKIKAILAIGHPVSDVWEGTATVAVPSVANERSGRMPRFFSEKNLIVMFNNAIAGSYVAFMVSNAGLPPIAAVFVVTVNSVTKCCR